MAENSCSFTTTLRTAVLFALYFFVFLGSETFLQNSVLPIIGSESLNKFFLGQFFCLAAGYLCLACCSRWPERRLRYLVAVLLVIPASSFVLTAFVDTPIALYLIGGSSSFCLGLTGGLLHGVVALSLYGRGLTGRMTGLSIGGAVFIQFLMDKYLNLVQTACLLAFASVVLAVLIAVVLAIPVHIADNKQRNSPSSRKLILIVVCTVFLSIIVGLNEGVITRLHATGVIDVTAWPRLWYMGGLVLAGFLADIRQRVFMPIATLCTLLLSSLAVFFLNSPQYYQTNLSILYFYAGFYVIYFTVIFLDIAPRMANPLLWAGMGRICRSLCVGAFPLCSNMLLDIQKQGHVSMLNTLLLGIVCVLFFWSGQLVLSEKQEHIPAIPQEKASIARFAECHALSRRELDVLTAVLESSESLSVIAARLRISERVLQRHLTSIYAKCHVSSRLGLVTTFYGAGTE